MGTDQTRIEWTGNIQVHQPTYGLPAEQCPRLIANLRLVDPAILATIIRAEQDAA